jgi:hypothetical protein
VTVVVITYCTNMKFPLIHETGILAVGVDPGAGLDVVAGGVPSVEALGEPLAEVSVALLPDVPLEAGVEPPVPEVGVVEGVEDGVPDVSVVEGVAEPVGGVAPLGAAHAGVPATVAAVSASAVGAMHPAIRAITVAIAVHRCGRAMSIFSLRCAGRATAQLSRARPMSAAPRPGPNNRSPRGLTAPVTAIDSTCRRAMSGGTPGPRSHDARRADRPPCHELQRLFPRADGAGQQDARVIAG